MPNWGEVLKEVEQRRARATVEAQQAVDLVRRDYLGKLFAKTDRNVIAYYSGWLSKPNIAQSDINDEDKNGFMMAVHGLDKQKGLDLILHTPGGSIAATESLVNYLHKMFGTNIRAIVPQIAMSAGTMIACSCKSIVLSKHSNLGPIDPQILGVPAFGVIQEFKRACREVKRDPSKASMWAQIVGQYRPGFLGQCQNSIDWSKGFVESELRSVMFAGTATASAKAKNVVKKLTDYRGNKTHSRHIHIDELVSMGLAIEPLEADPELQDLVLTVHHCYMHSLMNTTAFKMIENHKGAALVKRQAVVMQAVQG